MTSPPPPSMPGAVSGPAPVGVLAQVQHDLAELARVQDVLRARTAGSHLFDQLIALKARIATAERQVENNQKIAQELERDIMVLLLRRENDVLRARLGPATSASTTATATLGVRSAIVGEGQPVVVSEEVPETAAARTASASSPDGDGDDPITQRDLESIPISMRGGAKVAHVNELLRAVRTYFRKHPRKSTLSLTDLVSLVGARMAGRTGQCMINVLRSLGYIEYDAKRGLSLAGRPQPKGRI